MWQISRLYHPF